MSDVLNKYLAQILLGIFKASVFALICNHKFNTICTSLQLLSNIFAFNL